MSNINIQMAMPQEPRFNDIPQIMQQAEKYLSAPQMFPIDSILAVTEAVHLAMKHKVDYHMYREDSAFILEHGARMADIDSIIEQAGDFLHVKENPAMAIASLWQAFGLIKQEWNALYKGGYIAL